MSLHEVQISKTQRIAGYLLSGLASLMIVGGGLAKVAGAAPVVENMSNIPGFEDQAMIIGILEIALVVLYWFSKTSNLGFFLLASFTGGIIVAETVTGQFPFTGILLSFLFYAGTLMRKPSLLKI